MPDYSRDYSISHDTDAKSCSIRFRCFDTPNSVTVYGCGNDEDAESALLEVRRKCLELHLLWSFSLVGSEISRINDRGRRIEVGFDTAALIGAMKDFHEREPMFDFTIGPLSYLWKRASRLPSEREVEQALKHVGASKVRLEGPFLDAGGADVRFAVVKEDELLQIDIGGAAKGYAADYIANHIRSCGFGSANIDLGGNLYMLGTHPTGRPWRVSIRVPEGLPVSKTVVEVVDKSVVTSGRYERFVEIGGKRYQHIVDPMTGWPSESDIVSATVVSDSSILADMLATTALLVGSKGLDALCDRHRTCDFIAITADGAVLRPRLASS